MTETTKGESVSTTLQQLLEDIMAKYVGMAKVGKGLKESPERAHFEAILSQVATAIEAASVSNQFPNIAVKWSIGKGKWTECPWVGLFDSRVTTSAQHGEYVVFLFRRDMSAVYLTVAQGVTEMDDEADEAAENEQGRGIKWLRARSADLRPRFKRLEESGFLLDSGTDLRAKARGKKYQAGVIGYKIYEKSRVPADEELYQDIRHVLDVYTRYVDGRLEAAPEGPVRLPRILRIGLDHLDHWHQWRTRGCIAAGAEEFRCLRELQPGDVVIAVRGTVEVLAVGTVHGPGYQWLSDQHTVSIQWDMTKARHVPRQREWAEAKIAWVSDDYYHRLMDHIKPELDLMKVVTQFGAALSAGHLSFGKDHRHEEAVRSFIAALAAKRFAILTGLSGSGKTQIALRFGEWLGAGQSLLVPVRPDWTGSEALFGYVDGLVQPTGDGRRTWHVPKALQFMLKAAKQPERPYLLILDEMNLAHVERYFADVLSGLESNEPCLPDLVEEEGVWLDAYPGADLLPFPDNLFIVGTVNVDETTYMFSPKVLDRANTFEFRVRRSDLSVDARRPERCRPGELALSRGFLAVASDDNYHLDHPAADLHALTDHLKVLHEILEAASLEYGHRLFYEAIRFAAMMAAAGAGTDQILDRVVMQKILPRIHGTRRKLEDTVRALGRFCCDLTYDEKAAQFDPEKPPKGGQVRLPHSFDKVQRMIRSLIANQFTSFVE